MVKEYFDCLIIAPLEEEAAEIFKSFAPREDRSEDRFMVYEVDAGFEGGRALLAQLPDMGRQPAYETTRTLLDKYDIGLISCIGIAGRLSTDLKVGDVCYTGSTIDVYDKQKIKDAKGSGKSINIEFSPKYFESPPVLTTAINLSRANPSLSDLYRNWQCECAQHLQKLLTENKLIYQDGIFREQPISMNGALACAAISASKNYNAILKNVDRKLLAIETEVGGVFQAGMEAFQIPTLTIRGISDFADSKKTNLEENFKGVARAAAAHNAATFFKMQLENPGVLKFIRKQKQQRFGGQAETFLINASEMTALDSTLEALGIEIDSRLRELCPEYKLHQRGYHLPTPRIQSLQLQDEARVEDEVPYLELKDALSDHRTILVDLPRNYPGQGLPWVLAGELLTTTVGDRQIVPFVVDGDAIRPQTHGFSQLVAPHQLKSFHDDVGLQVVFIIPNIAFKSKPRREFLLSQMVTYPNAKFLFITRNEAQILLEDEFVKQIGARFYRLCAISFVAISQFIQQNFEMPPVQAEVIALRLKRTFSRFNLSAHPTYFAGIPRETLAALLQANRRAELIQLAVDGFLTFVVAADEADVSLSRTTRKVFLSNLAVEIAVQKRTFSQSELVEHTKTFSEKYDFDINPLNFINAFVEKGILRFEDDRVEFTLPFIRSYLLATALVGDEKLARQYFAIGEDDFDMQTFDLYAELGPSEEIIENIFDRLRNHKLLALGEGKKTEILLTNDIQPALLNKFTRAEEIRTGIQRTIKRLHEKDSDGERKQRLLDIADKVSQKAGSKSNTKQPKDKAGTQSKFEAVARDWVVGCVLLGAAAERLVAERKQELATLLVSLANALADGLTRERAKVDFKALKNELLASKDTEELLSTFEKENERNEMRQQIGYLIDFIEMSFLARPFRSVLQYLCEQARHKVLAKSVEKASANDLMQSIIHFAWLSDLDSKKGAAGLHRCLKSLPAAPFFRIILADHFVHRVYWSQARKPDRDALLKLASETIRPLGATIDKGIVMRRIEQNDMSGKRSS